MYRKILVGGATAAVVLGVGTAAMAASGAGVTSGAAVASTPPSASASTLAAKKKTTRGTLLRRASHAQITVKGKGGYVTHDFIRGTVRSVSATSITVLATDGSSETYSVDKATKVVARATTKGAKPTPSSIAKVATGDHVIVAGTGTTSLVARHLVDLGLK